MKKGWEVKNLGDIASVSYGFTGKAKIRGDFRYVRITDIDDNGQLTENEKKYLDFSEDAKNYLLKENDLLMARTGATFAKVLLYQNIEPAIYASYLIKISFEIDIINKLYWYFSKSESYWNQANKLSSGSAQPHFNGVALKKVIFTYPKSLTEQKEIVAKLDKAFAAIDKAEANTKQNIENAKELFQSRLDEIFTNGANSKGWVTEKLGDVCDKLFAGGDVPKENLSKVKTSKYQIPIYGNGEKNNGFYGYTDIVRVSEPSITVSARGTIGFTAMRTENYYPIVRLIVLIPNTKVVTIEFFYYFVSNIEFKNSGTSIPLARSYGQVSSKL